MKVSPMMLSLNNEAHSHARFMIQKKFQEFSSLEDISTLRNELQSKLTEADAKLKSAVQGKLDSLKRAVDLMEESSGKLTEFTETIDRIESRIVTTNTSIAQYPNLKRIHYAKDNLNKVIEQVKFVGNIPNRVKELRRILDEQPEKLKEVYLESLKLQAWRSALMKELQVRYDTECLALTSLLYLSLSPAPMQASRIKKLYDPRSSLATPSSSSPPPKRVVPTRTTRIQSVTEYEEDAYLRIIGVVGNHLEIVLDLSREIRGRLYGNIERMFDLSYQSPETLVETFEIVEMHQEYIDRRVERVKMMRRAGGEEITEETVISPSELGGGLDEETGVMGVRVKEDIVERLLRNIDEKIEGTFLLIQQELQSKQEETDNEELEKLQQEQEEAEGEELDGPEGDGAGSGGGGGGGHSHTLTSTQKELFQKKKVASRQIQSLLHISTRLIEMITEYKNEITPCIPPSYDFLSKLLDAFETQIRPQIYQIIDGVSILEVKDIMLLIDWLDYYVAQLGVFERSDRSSAQEFLSVSEELIHEYLFRIKSQVILCCSCLSLSHAL
jgi:hypothetical protein